MEAESKKGETQKDQRKRAMGLLRAAGRLRRRRGKGGEEKGNLIEDERVSHI